MRGLEVAGVAASDLSPQPLSRAAPIQPQAGRHRSPCGSVGAPALPYEPGGTRPRRRNWQPPDDRIRRLAAVPPDERVGDEGMTRIRAGECLATKGLSGQAPLDESSAKRPAGNGLGRRSPWLSRASRVLCLTALRERDDVDPCSQRPTEPDDGPWTTAAAA